MRSSNINTTIADSLIVLGKGNDGTSKDLGLIFDRSNNNANKGIIWDETNDIFSFIACDTETGTESTVDIDR